MSPLYIEVFCLSFLALRSPRRVKLQIFVISYFCLAAQKLWDGRSAGEGCIVLKIPPAHCSYSDLALGTPQVGR
jgi:hypothetical protein